MESANALCSQCTQLPAHIFCTCTSETFLCSNCFIPHSLAAPRLSHTTWPLSFLPYHRNPPLYQRLCQFPAVKQQANNPLVQIDCAIAGLEEWKSALVRQCNEKLTCLRELREKLTWEIPAAVEEVEHSLTEQQPELTSRLILPEKLPIVWENVLTFCNAKTNTYTQHTLAVDFGTGGSYLAMDSNTLICIGAEPASVSVYRLDLTSLLLLPLPALPAPREGTGVTRLASTVYVFGGCNAQGSDQKTSCKWTLSDSQWKPLPDMQRSRSFFTPCLYHSQIYLFAYSDLSIDWPWPIHPADSVTFTDGEELCLVTYGGQLVRWRLGESQVRLEKANQGCASTQQAVVVGELVLVAFQGHIKRFSLDSHSFLDEK